MIKPTRYKTDMFKKNKKDSIKKQANYRKRGGKGRNFADIYKPKWLR